MLLRNGTIWRGNRQPILYAADVLLGSDGTIRQVGFGLQCDEPQKCTVMDVRGRHVTPAIVDLHSHAGVDSWPYAEGTSDANELTQPVTPFLRAADAFDPEDPALCHIRGGGLGTILVLPGSGNLMGKPYGCLISSIPSSPEAYAFATGGQALVVKLRNVCPGEGQPTRHTLHVDGVKTILKMACGESLP